MQKFGSIRKYPYLCGRNRNKKNNIGNRKDIIATFAFKNVIDINDEE
jgi:hypothetical protein